MMTKINSHFEAQINNTVFHSKEIYELCVKILRSIECKFGEIYNNKFVNALKNSVKQAIYHEKPMSLEQIQDMWDDAIICALYFEEIELLPENNITYTKLMQHLKDLKYTRDPMKSAISFESKRQALAFIKDRNFHCVAKIESEYYILCPKSDDITEATYIEINDLTENILRAFPEIQITMRKQNQKFSLQKEIVEVIIQTLNAKYGIKFLQE